MQVDPNAVQHAASLYQDLKFWIPLITAGGLLLKITMWLKNLATKEDLYAQTTAIVNSIEGMREDMKRVVSPPPRFARARSSKKKIDTATEGNV